MRFQFYYKDYNDESSKNKSLTLLEAFINLHLLENFHGWSYECIFITFRNNAPEGKKDNAKRYLDQYAKVEVNGIFRSNRTYNLPDLDEGFRLIKQAAQLVDQISLKEKNYEAQKLMRDLEELHNKLPQTEEELFGLSKNKQAIEDALHETRVNGYLKASKEHPQLLNTRLIGVRIYDHFDKGALMPYSYMYMEIFSTLLRNENILTPHYKEIYFGIAKTIGESKMKSPLAINYWHKYTYCSLDIDKYNNSSEQEKNKMVFQSLCEGLGLIADTDHLDTEKVKKVIKHIEREGVNTLLTYKMKENNHYKVEIIYKVHPDHTKPVPFYLFITDKNSGKSSKVFINNFDTWWAAYSFGRIIIKKNEIVIKGKGGLRGEVSRAQDGLPEEHKFIIADVLNSEAHTANIL